MQYKEVKKIDQQQNVAQMWHIVSFLVHGELSGWLGNRDISCVNNGKFVINFQSSQV